MANVVIQDPPTYTESITKWDKQTLADGDQMGLEIEKLANNDAYLKGKIDEMQTVIQVTLTAAGWTGDSAPYSQTVSNAELKEANDYELVSMLEDGASEATQKAYVKAFGFVSSGTGSTADGSATFKVYKKPTTDIVVGLKGA